MSLDRALDFLLVEEGGWSNHKHDTGGATMFGVTQATYNAYRKMAGKKPQTVRNITKEEAHDLYDKMYWKEARCDRLPWPISYMVFDAAVNSGPSRGIKWMQEGIGVKADGQVGPGTIGRANEVVDNGDGMAILAIIDARATFLARLVQSKPTQAAFLLGWWRRTLRVLGRALTSMEDE